MSPELREPGGGPEKTRPASTVILVRQHSEGLQVYLLKRSPQSGFFPGNYVFPGGAVGSQDRDSQFWGARSDVPGAELSKRFGDTLKEEEILPFCVSAIRETFEEAGVLLADPGKSAGEWLGDVRNRRISGGLPKGWLLDGARNGSFMLGISLLAPWSHWITPEAMPRRFDTRFFVAFMPSEQISSPDCRETVKGIWTRPKDGLAANLKGEIALSPPTLVTLHQLLPYQRAEDLKAVLKGRSWGDPVIPRLIRLSRGAMIVEPWDPWYDRQLEIGADDLESAIVPLGEPFSRIWLHEEVWRPVRIQAPQGKKNKKRNVQLDGEESSASRHFR